MTRIKESADKALSFFAGETCASCGLNCGFLCEDCRKKLPFLKQPFCRKCAAPLQGADAGSVCGQCLIKPPAYQRSFVPFLYEGVIKNLVLDAKFNKKFFYLNNLFSILNGCIKDEIEALNDAEAVIPVPLSRKRLLQRGYNQSLIIASELSKILNLPLLQDSLVKLKDVPPQANLSREERFKNIKNAFSLRNKINFDKVILVDDIITTTATVREASKVLKKGGADEIYIFALCRTKD